MKRFVFLMLLLFVSVMYVSAKDDNDALTLAVWGDCGLVRPHPFSQGFDFLDDMEEMGLGLVLSENMCVGMGVGRRNSHKRRVFDTPKLYEYNYYVQSINVVWTPIRSGRLGLGFSAAFSSSNVFRARSECEEAVNTWKEINWIHEISAGVVMEFVFSNYLSAQMKMTNTCLLHPSRYTSSSYDPNDDITYRDAVYYWISVGVVYSFGIGLER